jgi:hypothetical protein
MHIQKWGLFTFGNVIELTDNGIEGPFESIIKPTDDPDKRILEGRINVRVSPLLQDRREVLTASSHRRGHGNTRVRWEYVHVPIDDHSRIGSAKIMPDAKKRSAMF